SVPDYRRGRLATVFADAGRVSFNIARVGGHLVKRRGEEEDETLTATNEIFLDRRHGARSTSRLSGAGNDPPRLGDRIDAAFGIHGGTARRSIVKIGSAIPRAIPRLAFEGCLECADMQSPHFGALVLAAQVGHPRKFPEVGVQKPGG